MQRHKNPRNGEMRLRECYKDARPATSLLYRFEMTEAWLLADESAIRAAAGNPNGNVALDLPPIRKLEEVPDPKELLHRALLKATGLNTRPRSGFPVHQRVHRILQFIEDFSMLDVLPAFGALQRDIARAIS